MNNEARSIKIILKIALFFALFIIIWGAFVRISGSGAGCGDSWPLCNNELSLNIKSTKTFIEYFHRATSGIFGILIIFLCILTLKKFTFKSIITKSSIVILFFTITEGLIGAVLVKKGLVVDNNSFYRAIVIGIHLCNTFFLTASIFFLLKLLKYKKPLINLRHLKTHLFLAAIIVFVIVAIFGTTAALSNTLYPSESIIEGIKSDFAKEAPLYVSLRKFHPLLAMLLFPILFYYFDKYGRNFKRLSINYLFLHYIFAFSTILLLAPIWMKLSHLLLTNILWLVIINITFSNLIINEAKS